MSNETACSFANDGDFGPIAKCREFDFTLTFEQSILGIGISTLLLLLFPLRVFQLRSATVKTTKSLTECIKLAAGVTVFGIQVVNVVLWAKNPITSVALAASIVGLLGVVAAVALVALEHRRSVRSSSIVLVYLLAAIASDAVQLRTLLIRRYLPDISVLICASIACKAVLLVLESLSKRSYLKPSDIVYSPEEMSNVFERSVLWWLNSLFLSGNSRILSQSDLCPLDRGLYSIGLSRRMHKSWAKYQHKENYGYLWATFDCFWLDMLLTVIPRAALIALGFAQVYFMNAVIAYLEQLPEERDVRKAYGLLGAAALIYPMIAVSGVAFQQQINRMVTKFRGCTASIIFDKSLTTVAKGSDMPAVTLMSTDIDRIAFSLQAFPNLWAQVASISIGIWLLYEQMGPVSLAPTLVIVLCAAVQSRVANLAPKMQTKWVAAVQRRIGITAAALRSVKSIKLGGMVEVMKAVLQGERNRELQEGIGFRKNIVAQNAMGNLPDWFSGFLVFAVFALQASRGDGPPLTTARAFTSLALINLVAVPSAMILQLLPAINQCLGLVKRVGDYLKVQSQSDWRLVSDTPEGKDSGNSRKAEDDDLALSVSEVVLGISTGDLSKVNPISFDCKRGTISLIAGPVGCGKSTLLRALLGVDKPEHGNITLRSLRIAYCAQDAWLRNCTIRENIIGPEIFDKERYDEILHLCTLDEDLSQLLLKDLTVVGAGGLILSGGQKHRIALARCIYSQCPLLILDDLFSSLDRKTQFTIAQRLLSKDGYVKRHNVAILMTTHLTTFLNFADYVITLEAGGSMSYAGTIEHWRRDHAIPPLEDPDPTKKEVVVGCGTQRSEEPLPSEETSEVDSKDSKRRSGDSSDWWYYLKNIGFTPIAVVLSLSLTVLICQNFPQIWLKATTSKTGSNTNASTFIGAYAAVSVVGYAALVGMIWGMMIIIAPKGAQALHYVLVTSTMRAPMSFFEKTDTSVMLNRFSQDMTLLDLALPMSSFVVLGSILQSVVNIAFICVGSTYLAATVPFTVFSLYIIQKFYLRTSRQMRLLDLEAKSPVYRHFTESLEGSSIIRGLGWQEHFEKIAIRVLDDSQKPYYAMRCIQTWLGLTIDLLIAVLALVLAALALNIPNSSSGGAIGVALTSILGLNSSLQELLTNWTTAETSLGSVARTKAFEQNTPDENLPDETHDPGEEWPQGQIKLSDVQVKFEDGTRALKGITFDIPKGKKFGVVGRTGSGKSTLLSSLLRLIEVTEGTIAIDGVDISKLPKSLVRNRLICLPQDPLLLPGTVRFNLDPEQHFAASDAPLSEALRLVNMQVLVDARGGLDTELQSSSLSNGERQLLALARAILRKRHAGGRCILVLDEATSNLDDMTEAVVEKVVAQEFAGHTVISVAHRLQTVRDADAVLVLDKGEVAKIGPFSEVV